MVNKRNHVTRSLSATTSLGPLKWLRTKILHVGQYRFCALVRGITREKARGSRRETVRRMRLAVRKKRIRHGAPGPRDFLPEIVDGAFQWIGRITSAIVIGVRRRRTKEKTAFLAHRARAPVPRRDDVVLSNFGRRVRTHAHTRRATHTHSRARAQRRCITNVTSYAHISIHRRPLIHAHV